MFAKFNYTILSIALICISTEIFVIYEHININRIIKYIYNPNLCAHQQRKINKNKKKILSDHQTNLSHIVGRVGKIFLTHFS